MQKDEQMYEFNDELAAVKKEDKWGFVNTQGEVVVPCIYDSTYPFSHGVAVVIRNSEWGYIDKGGKDTLKKK